MIFLSIEEHILILVWGPCCVVIRGYSGFALRNNFWQALATKCQTLPGVVSIFFSLRSDDSVCFIPLDNVCDV